MKTKKNSIRQDVCFSLINNINKKKKPIMIRRNWKEKEVKLNIGISIITSFLILHCLIDCPNQGGKSETRAPAVLQRYSNFFLEYRKSHFFLQDPVTFLPLSGRIRSFSEAI
jgi:hypothetical protein